MKNSIKIFMASIVLFFGLFALAEGPLTEKQKIEKLILEVENMQEASFIRNGDSFTGKQAAEHMRRKLSKAESSIWNSKKGKITVENFIEKIASKSSASGKDYLIKHKSGEQEKASEWLRKKLKTIQ